LIEIAIVDSSIWADPEGHMGHMLSTLKLDFEKFIVLLFVRRKVKEHK
jgi:hypothetical protein